MYVNVKPADGLIVKKPDGTVLSADGEAVPRTAFWLRRFADGDVVISENKQVAKAARTNKDKTPSNKE
ncbi:DUF2635 domain-containing protein [Plesiomonas shigelloides subsp. oncorhynchi]|nr:DUF2635 domain-containing protein [Plesiomonas shigelloides]